MAGRCRSSALCPGQRRNSCVHLCYDVLMANTTEHISIRLPKHIVDQLRKDAETNQRSLSWMIGFRLAQLAAKVDAEIANGNNSRVDGEAEAGSNRGRGNDRPTVSNVRPAKMPAKRLHKVQSVRSELVGGGGSEPRPAIEQGTLPTVEVKAKWCPVSPCQHGYTNSFACRRASGGC
jgi:hypothetical protein